MSKQSISLSLIGLLFAVFLFFSPSAAQSDLSPLARKAKQMVERAHEYVSEQAGDMAAVREAFETEPRFRHEPRHLYLFMHAYDAGSGRAVCIAQGIRPELVGKNMWGLRTPNGRLLFQEVVALMQSRDAFWLEYDWLNPYKDKIETKRSFFKKIILPDGRNAWIGCGLWKDQENR